MLEKQEYKGVWFLPEKPEHQVAGTLYFTPNETICLELIGDFSDDYLENYKERQVIHGIVKTQTGVSKITLFDCLNYGGSSRNYVQNCELSFGKYNCQYILLGKHLASMEDSNFYGIRVSFPLFNDWYKYNKIKSDIKYDSATFSFGYDAGNTRTHELNENMTLKLIGAQGYETKGHEYFLFEDSYVELCSTEKSPFVKLLTNVGWFKDFYSFAAMTAIPFSEIVLDDNDGFASLYYIAEEKFEKKGSRYSDFLFTFENIEQDFGTIIKNWYEKKENSEPIIQHLITSVTYRRFSKNSDFLTLIQAIEGYYNRFEKEESLATILTNLYEKYKDISLIALNNVDIKSVVDSRHYYTHILPAGKKKNVYKDWELVEVREKLKPLLICCILSLIGLSNEKIEELLSKHRYFRYSSILNKEND